MAEQSAILSFWYGEHEPLERVTYANASIWYKKDDALDAQIKALFEEDINRALAGEYDSWADESPAYGVALIVLLDQFSRNMYRGTPQMFAYDSKGLDIAKKLVEKGWDRRLPGPMRSNVYLPYMHSEEIEDQRTLLQLAAALIAEREGGDEAMLNKAKGLLDFAKKHHDIIERFGRFPHRNAILGRETTPEEAEFLLTHTGF